MGALPSIDASASDNDDAASKSPRNDAAQRMANTWVNETFGCYYINYANPCVGGVLAIYEVGGAILMRDLLERTSHQRVCDDLEALRTLHASPGPNPVSFAAEDRARIARQNYWALIYQLISATNVIKKDKVYMIGEIMNIDAFLGFPHNPDEESRTQAAFRIYWRRCMEHPSWPQGRETPEDESEK